jgi:imidazolonepropionase-like amidohydrolase
MARIYQNSGHRRYAFRRASRWGRYVAAHAHGTAGINAALRAGVRTIDHGSMLDDESIQLLKSRHVYFVPTLLVGEMIVERANPWECPSPRSNEGANWATARDKV